MQQAIQGSERANPSSHNRLKAKLSDPSRPYDRIQLSRAKPTVAAISEAQAILAETEPGDRPYADDPPPYTMHGPYTMHCFPFSMDRRERAALSDSLSLFLDAPDPALYLSQLQEGA